MNGQVNDHTNDHLTKAIAGGVRVFAAVTTNLTGEAAQRHGCHPTAAAALGRVLTGGLLLAANLKTSECITLKIDGDGPLGKIVADANADGVVRGYIEHPEVDLPLENGKLAVGTGVGRGVVSVKRFTGLKQPFEGSAALISGEIAEDLTQYLYVSEQTPSSVGLGVLVGQEQDILAAGGFFIQALPEADDAAITRIEENIKTLPPVSQMVHDGLDAKGMIAKLFDGLDITYLTTTDLAFRCQCSRERIEQVLLSLGKQDLSSLVDDGKAEVCCHFCGEKYQFDKNELTQLLEQVQDKA